MLDVVAGRLLGHFAEKADVLLRVKGDVDVMVQSQLEKLLAKKGLVSREDFDAAQMRITALVERIAVLESEMAALSAKKTKQTKAKTAKKS